MQFSWPFGASRILIVDDNRENVNIVRELFEHSGDVQVEGVLDPTEAIDVYRCFQPDVVLLDLHMPKLNGFQVLEQLKDAGCIEEFVPVLVCTAEHSQEAKKKVLDFGASDFITKPFDAAELLLRVRNFFQMRQLHLKLQEQKRYLEDRVAERTKELIDARTEAMECLARAAEFRDDSTGQHTKRVGENSARIAKTLALDNDQIELIRLAAPLHDVGKIGISDLILLKPDKLTPEEFDDMKRHTHIGSEIIGKASSPLLAMARSIALHHHERWDGSGYPLGLSGEEIPIDSRIVAVADVFDALVHERPYKSAWTVDRALDELRAQSGKQFDPKTVEAFISLQPDCN